MDPSLVLWDVVEEHLDEAEFLFEQWDLASVSPAYSSVEIEAGPERRLKAHLDGLVVAGAPAAERLLEPGLLDAGGGGVRAGACALALLEQEDDAGARLALGGVVAATDDALRAGIARALEVSNRPGLSDAVKDALYAVDGPAQLALLRVLAARRVDPGPILKTLLRSQDPEVLSVALRAAVACRAEDIGASTVEALLDAPSPGVQLAAAELALSWGMRAGWFYFVQHASSGNPQALLMLAMFGVVQDTAVLVDALRAPAWRHAALVALGYAGRPEGVDACLSLLGDKDALTAKLAGEALCAITGLVPDKKMCLDEPEDDGELPPLADDLSKDLGGSVADGLPMLDPGLAMKWWRERSGAFDPGRRYVRGVLAGPGAVEQALREGPTRAAARRSLELQVRSGAAVLVPTLRFGWRAALGAALGDAAMRVDWQRSLSGM